MFPTHIHQKLERRKNLKKPWFEHFSYLFQKKVGKISPLDKGAWRKPAHERNLSPKPKIFPKRCCSDLLPTKWGKKTFQSSSTLDFMPL